MNKMFTPFVKCTFLSLTLSAALTAYTHASYIGSDLGVTAGVHAAGLLGSYAGALSGGKALSELDLGKSSEGVGDIELETHDFSEHDASKSSIDEHVASTLGDHLSEHSFPTDYGSDADVHTSEYAEDGHHELAEASEIHAHEDILGGGFEEHNHLHDFQHGIESDHQHFEELQHEHDGLSLHGHEDLYDSKPVPGIDHGKGAFSYSTLYEFKDKLSDQ